MQFWKKNLALIIIYVAVVGFFASVVLYTSDLKYELQDLFGTMPEHLIQDLAGGWI